MRLRPPRTTRTYTLFPYPTLFRSQANPASFPLLGLVAWIVRRVGVGYPEGALAVDLHDRARSGPDIMVHPGRRLGEAARLELLALGGIQLVAHAERQLARNDRDELVLGVRVGRNLEARREAVPHREGPRLPRIPGQHQIGKDHV